MRSIYENGAGNDAEGIAYRLHGLCRVGAAASDSLMNIDLSKGGYIDLFETMAGLCDQLVDAISQAEKDKRKA